MKTLYDVERETCDHPYEVGHIINKKGELIHRENGNERSVSPPPALIKNNIFTHNHPSGLCSFSLQDVLFFIAHDGYEMRVVTAVEIVNTWMKINAPKYGYIFTEGVI